MQRKQINSLSFGIVCYDTPKSELQQLFDSLLIAIDYLRKHQTLYEVIIYLLDNSDPSPAFRDIFGQQLGLAKKLGVKLKYIHGHGNIGYGRAQNLILQELTTDLHAILNSDISLEEDALVEAVRVFMRNPSIVMLSPSAKDSLGVKQYLCKRYPSISTLFVRGFLPKVLQSFFRKRLDRYEMRDLSESTVSENIQLVSGCFMLADTKALQKANGFDEKYFLYFEDFDLSLRIQKLGLLVYAPNVRIIHKGGEAARKGLRHIGFFVNSGFKFFSSHGWRFI
ncbi:glycosyltransferase [Gammaproteobacteria bacterium]|nr:glycosyltransferase [Gammaproteobacteria bacterium]